MLALMVAVTPAAAQQVTELVPSDALVVIKIRNLQDTSKKMGALAQQLGIAGMNPAASDPLGAFQQQTGISEGLNAAGDAAIVFLNEDAAARPAPAAPPAEGEDVEDPADEDEDEKTPAMLVLIPVSDYQAFLKSFGEPRNEGDLAIVNFKDQEKDVYVANWGSYAALADNKAYLADKPQGLKVGGATGKELETKDITVYANMKAVRDRALPKLQQNREKILAEVERGITEQGQADPKYIPVIKAAVNQGLNLAEQFLKETEAGTYGVALSDQGINTTMMAEFAPGTEFGKTVSQLKGSDESLLSGLPQGKYLLFGGGASDPQVTLNFFNNLIGPIEKELAGLGEEGKAIQTYLQSLRQYIGAVQSSRFGMVAPGGQLGQEAIIQGVGIARGDGQAMATAYKQMMQQSEELMAVFGSGTAQPKTVITEDAKTVDGVTLDMFQTQFASGADAQDPQAQQMAQMMTMMYGPNGLTGYVGVVEDKLVQATNLSDAMLQSTIAAAKADEDNLGGLPGMAATKKQLPSNRVAELYIPLDVVVNTGVTYANQFGMPIKLQLPANLPPIGLTAGAEGTAFRFDSHVPSQLVQSLVTAGMQAFMQMQQGAQPGGPGGL
jgi:hypothetical protein